MTSSPIWLERTELLINNENLEKLAQLNVLIVGLGGVGSFAAEFLARAGIGIMTIVDGDVVDITNTNRQLPAMHSTVGKSKAVLMQERLLDINPALRLRTINQFINPEESSHLVNSEAYDYVLDCIDSVTPKLLLIKAAKEKGCKIISSMGAGGKVDSMMIKYADISKTHICPFAYYIRKRLRHEGIYGGVMTVFSEEKPIRESIKVTEGLNYKRSFYGTISYIPALFGLNMASWVVRDACGMFEPTPLCIPKKEKRRGE
ncbi:MAG: tRNA threonylcarbamoyladenosine dehydratase [Bacteroidetes bacterium]|jgi:tRNA A37 threonylcarbamoyladenosine dehydratase|nr:tRNA threonylcarbamoyladenosine dehydratase [Bacteroidota bacterium]